MENTLLNLVPASYLPEVHLSQYDVGRTITFTLKDGASDYSVPSGASITVKATKPSGLGFEVACTFNGGTVTLVTTDTMTPENGRFPAELSIVSGNTTIGTSNFIFNIERSPHPEGTIDGDAETIIPELTLLVERIEAAAEDVDEDTQTVTEAKAEVLQAKADTLQAKADTLSARDESVSAKDLAVSSAQTSVEASERAEQLVGSVSTKADAIVKTASGEIASFTDGGDDLPMKSLKVNIVPKQSGSGDPSPSNVRPISGYTTVHLTVSSGNLFGGEVDEMFPLFIPQGTKVSAYSDTETKVYYYNQNRTNIDYWSVGAGYTRTFNIIADAYYFKFETNGGATPTKLAIEYGDASIASNYKPFTGLDQKPISLGQTVYGGTLEVMSGKLTINNAMVDLGTLTWRKGNASAGHWRFGATFNAKSPTASNKKPNAICSKYPTVTPDDTWLGRMGITVNSANHDLLVVDENYSDADTFKASLSGVQFVYELITPIEVTLTPTQVKTLLGNNNIWADSGSVEVEYRADTTLAYNELLSLIASLS